MRGSGQGGIAKVQQYDRNRGGRYYITKLSGGWSWTWTRGSDSCSGTSAECAERMTGYLMIGKLKARTGAELNRAALVLIADTHLPVRTITADNGTEFHGYTDIGDRTGPRV